MSPMSAASPPTDLLGNDNTFVAASTPRHTWLSKRIAALSVSTIASSTAGVESVAAAVVIARRMTNPASLLRLQRLDLTITSIFNAGNARRADRFFKRLRLGPLAFCRRLVVGLDNARDEFVADDVGGREVDMGNPFDAFQQLYRFGKA
jgi:hypothetical protein